LARDKFDVLLIGETSRSEMLGIAAMLDSDAAVANVTSFVDIHAVLSHADLNGWFPDLVVVCQSWPNEFVKAEVDDLIGRFPLARVVCCFGVWCESDGRNCDGWPNALRVSARTARRRICSELQVLADERVPLPLTASRDETFEFDHTDLSRQPIEELSAAVISPDPAIQGYLESALKSSGLQIADGHGTGASDLVLWDIDPCNDEVCRELREFCRRVPNATVVVMSGLSHPEDENLIKSAGAHAVVPKLATPELLSQTARSALAARRT